MRFVVPSVNDRSHQSELAAKVVNAYKCPVARIINSRWCTLYSNCIYMDIKILKRRLHDQKVRFLRIDNIALETVKKRDFRFCILDAHLHFLIDISVKNGRHNRLQKRYIHSSYCIRSIFVHAVFTIRE